MIEESKKGQRNERKINEDGKWYRKAKKEEEMRERLMRMVSAVWNVLNKGYTIIKEYYTNTAFLWSWYMFIST